MNIYTRKEFITGQQSDDLALRDVAARYGWYGARAYDVYLASLRVAR